MAGPIALRGQRELLAALAKADRETRLGVRRELRGVAERVRREAQTLALSAITGMAKSPKWARMRTGVSRKLVYVAPRQRGVRWNKNNPGYRFSARRPNLADLLMTRAMQPALDRHAGDVERALEDMLDHVADDFNKGGL